jgi:hypothetical protein
VKSTQGSSRPQDSTDQLKAVLRKRHGDQGGSGVAGGEESGGGPNSPTAVLNAIPTRLRTEVGAACSGRLLGTRRYCCAALGKLGSYGAAILRWSREVCVAMAMRAWLWCGGGAGVERWVRATNGWSARIAGVTGATRRKRIVERLSVIPGSGRSF